MAIKKNLSSAEFFYKNNNIVKAREICESLLEENKKDLNTINLLIDINIKIEKFDRALEYINKALKINSQNYKLFFKKGIVLFKLNKFEDALENSNKTINLNNNFAEAYNLKAVIYENLNNDKEALNNWDKAIKINPKYSEAYFNKANYYKFNDNYELSLETQRNLEIKLRNSLSFPDRTRIIHYSLPPPSKDDPRNKDSA